MTLLRVLCTRCGSFARKGIDALNANEPNLDLLWGAERIAKAIGRERSITYYLLEKGEIAPARKVCGRWCVSRRALAEFFGTQVAA